MRSRFTLGGRQVWSRGLPAYEWACPRCRALQPQLGEQPPDGWSYSEECADYVCNGPFCGVKDEARA